MGALTNRKKASCPCFCVQFDTGPKGLQSSPSALGWAAGVGGVHGVPGVTQRDHHIAKLDSRGHHSHLLIKCSLQGPSANPLHLVQPSSFASKFYITPKDSYSSNGT